MVAGRSTSQSSPFDWFSECFGKGVQWFWWLHPYIYIYICICHIISYYCHTSRPACLIETRPLSPFCRRTDPRWPAGSAAVGGWHGRQLPGRRLKVQSFHCAITQAQIHNSMLIVIIHYITYIIWLIIIVYIYVHIYAACLSYDEPAIIVLQCVFLKAYRPSLEGATWHLNIFQMAARGWMAKWRCHSHAGSDIIDVSYVPLSRGFILFLDPRQP